MKRFLMPMIVGLIGVCALAVDINKTPLKPQDGDSSNELLLRQVEAVARAPMTWSTEFTRPATTTSYAAEDVISTNETANSCMPICFTNVLNGSGGGMVTKARVTCNDKTATWSSELWLFSSTNGIYLQGDNQPCGLKWADNGKRIGPIAIPALSAKPGTDTDMASAINSDIRLTCASGAGVTNLWGYLVIKSAWSSPPSGAKIEVKLSTYP